MARSYSAVWAKASPASRRRSSAVVQPWATIWSRTSQYWRAVGGDGGKGVILGRGADHRRPANVDLLDGFVPSHALACDGRLERIKIDHHQLEGKDAVLGRRFHVLRVIVPGEDAAVDLRMDHAQTALVPELQAFLWTRKVDDDAQMPAIVRIHQSH